MRANIFVLLASTFLTSCLLNGQQKETGAKEWTHHTTTHFNLKAQNGVRHQSQLKSVGQQSEAVQQELLQMLQEQKKQNLQIYLLKDRDALENYTGFAANGYTDTQKGVIYLVDKDPLHLPIRHEMMHALTWRLWGLPKGYWLSEGIAVFAARRCAGYNLHVLAHAISKQNKLVPFHKLTDTFDFRALEPSLQSASLVQYIYDKYGVKALKGFWQYSLKSSSAIIGISAVALEKQWKDFIDDAKFEATIDWNRIKQSGCE